MFYLVLILRSCGKAPYKVAGKRSHFVLYDMWCEYMTVDEKGVYEVKVQASGIRWDHHIYLAATNMH